MHVTRAVFECLEEHEVHQLDHGRLTCQSPEIVQCLRLAISRCEVDGFEVQAGALGRRLCREHRSFNLGRWDVDQGHRTLEGKA